MRAVFTKAAHTALTLSMLVLGFVIMAHVAPVDMSFLPHEPYVASKHDKAVQRVSDKCETVPPGQLPTAAAVLTVEGKPYYTHNPKIVSIVFEVAVGERSIPSNMAEVKPCA